MPRRAQSYSEIDQVLKIIKKAAKNNQNASKKRKIDEPILPLLPQGSKYQDLREMKIKECQICGESGLIGFTDIYNISLREQSNNCLSFVEVVNYVLGISVSIEQHNLPATTM
jgi:queuine/archaeosine tRNA-ribosyltransferase